MRPRGCTALGLLLTLSVGAEACSLERSAVAPSGFDAAVPDVGTDTSPPPLDSGPPPIIPCADFGERQVLAVIAGEALFDGASHQGTEREAPGNIALEANPYRYGAWLVAGHEDPLLGDPPAGSDLDGHVATALAYRNDFDVAYDDRTPPHELLIAGDGTYTVEMRGEVRLARGVSILHGTVENRMVLEVEVAETVRTLSLGTSGTGEVSVDVPRDGWYALRGAWQSDGGPGALRLEVTTPSGDRREIWVEEMRADARLVEGREVHGWENREHDGDPSGSVVEEAPTDWSSAGSAYPGVGIGSDDNWATRWVGRHELQRPFETWGMSANQGGSLFVDGVFLGAGATGMFDSAAPDGTVDVIAELWDGPSSSAMLLTVNDAPFTADQLRPASRFGGVPHGRGAEFTYSVSAGSSRSSDVVLSGVPSGRPSAVEVSVIVRADDPTPIDVTIAEPGGLTETRRLVDAAWSRQPGEWHLRWVPDWADTLTDVNGTWQVTVDNTGGENVLWHHAGVLAHLDGVSEPFPRSGTFRTAFIDLGDETLIRGVRGGGVVTGRSGVQFGIRAGNTPVDVPFAPTDAAGDLPAAIRGRYVQIEVNLTGPGWDTPRIRDLRLVGDACRRCADVDPEACPEERASAGLTALWMFDEGTGNLVRDVSAFRTHDLITPSEAGWAWAGGHLTFETATAALTVDRPVDAIREAIVVAGEFTVEAWIRPEDRTQGGPARILTLSEGTSSRNVTLGQEGDAYVGRIRQAGSEGGTPFATSADGSVQTSLQHVVLTALADGTARFWVDGAQSGDSEDLAGDFANWDRTFRLYLGNVDTTDRPWLGQFHLVAMYSRALTETEIERHHRIGPRLRAAP